MKARGAVVAAVLLLLVVAGAWRLLSGSEAPERAARVLGAVEAPVAPRRSDLPEPVAPPPDERPAVPARPPTTVAPHLPGLVVRRADGTPLPGTRVALVTADEAEQPLAGPIDTDAEGRFDLRVDTPPDSARLRLTWQATARSLEQGLEVAVPTGHVVRADLEVQRAEFTTGVPRRIELDTGWMIGGAVVDGRGGPVHAARLVVAEVYATAESDLEGAFLLRDIPSDRGAVEVFARAPGREVRQVPVAAPPPEKDRASVLIELPECASLKGVVVHDSGAPLDDVEVCLVGATEIAPGPFVARTGPEGAFAFRGVPEGRFDLVARVDDEQALRLAPDAAAETWVHDVLLACGANRDVRLVVANGVTQRGQVLDFRRRPLTNHVVAARALRAVPCHPSSWSPAASAETDSAGRFVLRRLAPGPFELTVEGIPSDCVHGDGGQWHALATRGAGGALSQHGAPAGPPRPVELRHEVEVAHVANDVELVVAQLGEHPERSLLGWPPLRLRIGAGFSGRERGSVQLFDTEERARVTGEHPWSDLLVPINSETAAGLLVFSCPGKLPRVAALHDAQLENDFGEIVLEDAPALDVVVTTPGGESLTCDIVVHWLGGGRVEQVDHREARSWARLRADRREGHFELTVSAPGYRRWRQVGLVPKPGEAGSAEVELLRW